MRVNGIIWKGIESGSGIPNAVEDMTMMEDAPVGVDPLFPIVKISQEERN